MLIGNKRKIASERSANKPKKKARLKYSQASAGEPYESVAKLN